MDKKIKIYYSDFDFEPFDHIHKELLSQDFENNNIKYSFQENGIEIEADNFEILISAVVNIGAFFGRREATNYILNRKGGNNG